MGWPDKSMTQENLDRIFDFYITRFAKTVVEYAQKHTILPATDIADAFFDGFAAHTREISWNYTTRREQFDRYEPRIFGDYKFDESWRFILWSLEQQTTRLDDLSKLFYRRFDEFLAASGQDEGSRDA
jgi:hypothetical protein